MLEVKGNCALQSGLELIAWHQCIIEGTKEYDMLTCRSTRNPEIIYGQSDQILMASRIVFLSIYHHSPDDMGLLRKC